MQGRLRLDEMVTHTYDLGEINAGFATLSPGEASKWFSG